MKISIVYHSNSGNTEQVAQIISEGILEAGEIDVKCMHIEEIDYAFLDASKTVIFGSPTYYGTLAWQIKQWFDTSWTHKLSGKLGAVFATEDYVGGGADFTLLALIGHVLVKGMVVYSGGSAEGNPYIHYGAVCVREGTPDQQERAKIFGRRVGKKTLELFSHQLNTKES